MAVRAASAGSGYNPAFGRRSADRRRRPSCNVAAAAERAVVREVSLMDVLEAAETERALALGERQPQLKPRPVSAGPRAPEVKTAAAAA